MPVMGRRRKNPDSGLEARVYERRGAFYYVHRSGEWEPLGKDRDAANRKARIYNDPDGLYGTLVHWLERWLLDLEHRVRGGTLAQRTLDDYREAVGTPEAPGALRTFFPPPITPADVTPAMVSTFLKTNADLGRSTRANREKSALSSCISWIITSGEVPGLIVNPCMRGSGVKRNKETKRERYVTDEEFREVYAMAGRSERLMMDLAYRTLQRPDSDIIHWTTEHLQVEDGRLILDFVQRKTGKRIKIALPPELAAQMPGQAGAVVRLRQPLVRRLDGEAYTYDGLGGMLRESIRAANERRKARKLPPIPSFGYRDLKGKGATDMWLAGVPLERIQLLCGHSSKTTTEIYVKQRWRETAEPNQVQMR